MHGVDIETGGGRGCTVEVGGAFELPVVKAVTVFTFKRDEIKRPKV